jgi:hypothetical protein
MDKGLRVQINLTQCCRPFEQILLELHVTLQLRGCFLGPFAYFDETECEPSILEFSLGCCVLFRV